MPARRTSDAAKEAGGTMRPHKHIPQPRYVPKAPKMPEWLPKRAQQVWKRIVPELRAQKILCVTDLDMLALYCEKSAKFRECCEKNTHFSAADTTQFRMCMAELGLTPASRLRAPPLVEDPEPQQEAWQNEQRAKAKAIAAGKVVDMSDRLSSIAKTLGSAASMSASTSDEPAPDKSTNA